MSPRLARASACSQPIVEQDAVGQAGQRVVQRHVGDLGLGAALLGDVLVGGDRAAVGHRLHGDGDRAPVAELAHELLDIAGVALAQQLVHQLLGRPVGGQPVVEAMLDQLAQRRSDPGLLGRQP